MLEYLKLKGVGPAPEMEMELAPRLNIITGDNGLGKTFLLDIAWWSLTRTWARMPAAPPRRSIVQVNRSGHELNPSIITYRYDTAVGNKYEYPSTFNRQKQLWSVKKGRPPIPGMVIYAQVDGGFSSWDPARNYWKKQEPGEPERPPAFLFQPDEVWNGMPRLAIKKLCNGLILDLASWQHENGDSFAQLTRVLDTLSPSGNEALIPGELTRVSMDDVRDHPTLHMPYDQNVALAHASAGMRRIVALAYLLVWTWQEHLRACEFLGVTPAREIIFLIDEIECHLHPQWQRRIVPALLSVMKALTQDSNVPVQVIAATHSPLIMSSLEPIFDPSFDAWFDLDLVLDPEKKAASVVLEKQAFIRRGTSGRWLTSPAFDLKSEGRPLEAERAIEAAELLLEQRRNGVNIGPAEVDEVDQALRSVLSDIDRFWVRWSAVVDELKGEEGEE